MDDTATNGEQQTKFGGISRRSLIRLLVGSAIGIPVAVEGRTLIGLLDKHFFGGETHDRSPSDGAASVGVGDELLPATTPIERVSRLLVDAPDQTWTFRLDVAVENTGDSPYEFLVGGVTTTSKSVEGSTTTGSLDPGEETLLSAEWPIPEGSTPTALEVTGIIGASGADETVSRDVTLGNVPVKRRS